MTIKAMAVAAVMLLLFIEGGRADAADDILRAAIGPCWRVDALTARPPGLWVMLTITTDRDGVVRRAVIAPEDAARVGADPVLQRFAEHAVRTALLDPKCARLPLPQAMLGQMRTFTFRFDGMPS
jgi:hypothetical protein